MPPPGQDVIAVFNTSPDTIHILAVALERAGFTVVSAYTFDIRDKVVNLDDFIARHQPKVIVYDIAPPYDVNFALLQDLRTTEPLRDRLFVLTSTNVDYVQRLAGRDERVYEIIGKPYDLGQVVAAVKETVRQRPVR